MLNNLDGIGRATLVNVCDHFITRNQWPLYREVEVTVLDRKPLGFILRDLPDRVLAPAGPPNKRALQIDSLAWFAACPGAADDVARFLHLVSIVARRSRQTGGDERVVRGPDLQALMSLSDAEAERLMLAMDAWGGRLRSGGTGTDRFAEWWFGVSDDALYFANVTTAQEFEDRHSYVDEVRMAEATPFWRKHGTGTGTGAPTRLPSVQPLLGRSEPFELHVAVADAAGSLFASGHYSQAVREAVQRLEHFMQDSIDELSASGHDLAGRALGGDAPRLRLNALKTGSDLDEQLGYLFLAKGVFSALRNVYSHGEPRAIAKEDALEQLAVVSLVFRRVEEAARAVGRNAESHADSR